MKFSLASLPGRLLALALCFCLVFSLVPALQAAAQPFSDVPADSFAYEDILFLREQGITQGIGNNEYGTYLTFKRCDFVLMLGRLMGWDLSQTPKASDVPQDHYAAGAVAAAEAHGLTESTGSYSFRPDDAITREEMAVMLVRALGISSQAENSLAALSLDNPFLDLSPDQNPDTFYGVHIAYDLGIIQGQTAETPTTFDPKGTATREQTAAMMMRFYRVSQTDLSELHGFYAISSYSQKDKISSLTSMTTGWSRMEYGESGPWLNTTSAGNNDWAVPAGSQEIFDLARESQVSLLLGVYLDLSQTYEGNTQASLILSEENREAAVEAIVDFLRENPSYQGVTIDFEGFVSESYKAPFTAFLTLLRQKLDETGSYLLYCALPPMENYQGYDWRAIGDIVDKVILMATTMTPIHCRIISRPTSPKRLWPPSTRSIRPCFRSPIIRPAYGTKARCYWPFPLAPPGGNIPTPPSPLRPRPPAMRPSATGSNPVPRNITLMKALKAPTSIITMTATTPTMWSGMKMPTVYR